MTERQRKRPNLDGETAIQKAVFQHLRLRGAPGIFACHPRNGGRDQRGRRSGINSGQGVVSGVPDVLIWRPMVDGGGMLTCLAYGLELKTLTGVLSPAQETVLPKMRTAGVIVAVAFGLDAALKQLEAWGLLRGTAA